MERPSISTSGNSSPRRVLIDYTQCRQDGTISNKQTNLSKAAATEHPRKRALVMGLPSCNDLDASLYNMSFFNDTEDDEGQNEKDRIDFYLKVAPKSQRKHSRRISTLDALPEQVASSTIDLIVRSAATASATRMKHTRSSSAPIPSTVYATFTMGADPIDDILVHNGSSQHATASDRRDQF